MPDKNMGTFINRVLEGDGFIVDTGSGPVEFFVERIDPVSMSVKIAIRADRSMPITQIHLNPHRTKIRLQR